MARELCAVQIVVSGLVQGVFYRASTVEQALARDLRGWVKNLRDGSVEIQAEGERARLESLIAWCQEGPAGADVTDVSVRWGTHRGRFDGFTAQW